MSQHKAVTKAVATRYKRADKAGKCRSFDEFCATTGWHRIYARKELVRAVTPRIAGRRGRRRAGRM